MQKAREVVPKGRILLILLAIVIVTSCKDNMSIEQTSTELLEIDRKFPRVSFEKQDDGSWKYVFDAGSDGPTDKN